MTGLVVLALTGCGAKSGGGVDPVKPSVGGKVVLKTFGAFSCGICSEELPELKRKLEAGLSVEEKSRVSVEIFVVDANSELRAEEYKNKLGLSGFTAKPDFRCREEYRKFWSSGCSVPGTVLVGEEGVIRNFGIGAPNIEKVVEAIKNEI